MENRIKRIIFDSINKFELNLEGLTIFTEAATGNYLYTPIISALAGAKKVYAIAKDSKYGAKETVKKKLAESARQFCVDGKIEIVYGKIPEQIHECDIITNSGFVRPINKEMINSMKKTAVISLMFEPWEFRAADIDRARCEESEIPVMGTNEDHDNLKLFFGNGFLISKLLFESGFEIYKNKFLIIGSGKIGRSIQDFFERNSIEYKRITFDKKEALRNVVFAEDFDNYRKWMERIDCVILCEHMYGAPLISKDGLINEKNIKMFLGKTFIHLCGKVDGEFAEGKITIYPKTISNFGYMTKTVDYLGPLLTIELNTAGLKVGEIMARSRIRGNSYAETIECSRKNTLVMDFEQ